MKRTLVALVAALAWSACAMPDFKPLEVGDKVPAFTASTLDGEEFNGADLVGSPYMLNIWATWCAPCRHEMPELQELHETFSGQGFQVVGVSVDDRGSRPTIREFLAEVGVTFPIYHDPSWEIQDLYGLLGLPGSFLMDAEGRLVRRWTGSFKPMAEDVQEEVRKLVGTAAQPPPPEQSELRMLVAVALRESAGLPNRNYSQDEDTALLCGATFVHKSDTWYVEASGIRASVNLQQHYVKQFGEADGNASYDMIVSLIQLVQSVESKVSATRVPYRYLFEILTGDSCDSL